MRVCVVGAGAIGCFVGARLARGGAAVAEPSQAGAQDVVILAAKAHQVAPLAAGAASLLREEGSVLVTMQNGIPWGYFQEHGGALRGRVLASVDPGGNIAERIPAQRILGCVACPACELQAPGTVRHVEGERFPVSALARATLGTLRAEPRTRALAVAMMGEAEAVARNLGVTLRVSIERRIEGAAPAAQKAA